MAARGQRPETVIIVTIGVAVILMAIAYVVYVLPIAGKGSLYEVGAIPRVLDPTVPYVLVPSYQLGGGGAPPTTTPSAHIHVEMYDYRFDPSNITVRAGTVEFMVENHGSVPHTFTISELNIDVVVPPGGSRSITVNLSPGTYRVICRFHVNQGMVAQLVVTG